MKCTTRRMSDFNVQGQPRPTSSLKYVVRFGATRFTWGAGGGGGGGGGSVALSGQEVRHRICS